tara:strand:+ start:1224 stop:1922 length:699 start_codon:yes stop_codon:yes gene_type:complete
MSKVLLVGNGGSLTTTNLSDKINSFDVVCRFNWGGSKISFDKYNKFIGNKKNIWFNFNISNLVKDKKITTNSYNIEYLNSYEKIYISGIDWITNPTIKSTTNSIENFIDLTSKQFDMIRNSNMINLNEIFDTEINNVWIFPNNYSELIRTEISSLSKNIPTTGLKAIHFLLKEYPKLYLCGFDGFKSSHFYGDEEHNNIVKVGYENDDGHSGKREIEYIKKLEKQNKIEFVN